MSTPLIRQKNRRQKIDYVKTVFVQLWVETVSEGAYFILKFPILTSKLQNLKVCPPCPFTRVNGQDIDTLPV